MEDFQNDNEIEDPSTQDNVIDPKKVEVALQSKYFVLEFYKKAIQMF